MGLPARHEQERPTAHGHRRGPPQRWVAQIANGNQRIADMASISRPSPVNRTLTNRSHAAYFDERRAMIDDFVARHFTWPGTFRLHAAAFGWDILRAPLNVVLSPILVLSRIVAYLCRRAGLRRAADWLGQRRILLRTEVARRVETLIATELLGLSRVTVAASRDPAGLARAVLAAPQLREMIRNRPSPAEAERVGRRIAGALGDYAGTRSAVAEMTVAFCALALGALLFRALTPGMLSMAPGVADAIARSSAVAAFPLGETFGHLWYGVFAADSPSWLVGATVAGLVMIGSMFAAFAGILADPVQSRLGIHRRRLERLLETIETELLGAEDKSFVAREHFYARILDLWDAVASALRVFRG